MPACQVWLGENQVHTAVVVLQRGVLLLPGSDVLFAYLDRSGIPVAFKADPGMVDSLGVVSRCRISVSPGWIFLSVRFIPSLLVGGQSYSVSGASVRQ